MAMLSSRKSGSMAAVLLLVAVVVAGTCVSGARADFNITNKCIRTVVINTGADSYTLRPGGILTWSGLPSTFFVAPVTITIRSIPIVTVTIPTASLDYLKLLRERLISIDIECDGNCITLYVTYYSLLPPQTIKTTSLGPFCSS